MLTSLFGDLPPRRLPETPSQAAAAADGAAPATTVRADTSSIDVVVDHSPTEASRVLGNAIQKAELARHAITRVLFAHGVSEPVTLPDISTKAKAQAWIGLDMDQIRETKEKQREELFPKWDQAAAQREAALPPVLTAGAPRYQP
ncbi:MAG: Cytochrome c-552 precursor [Actinobacteria bacterium ADurb.Bin444]|nr:MAG: Cytochrome c-552 precursor [Actinobacteria bacterium ADurb.Bin444]